MSDEKILIIKAKDGDKKAFSVLVTRYQKYAFNLAFRFTCNEDDAKDIVQDSFIKIWNNINSFNSKNKFSTWMYKIITNTAIDQKRGSKQTDVGIEDINEKLIKFYEDPETQYTNEELAKLINESTKILSEKQRVIFVLKDLQGLTTDEVCQIMNQTAETVKSNLYHARKSVRNYLNQILNFEKVIK